MKIDTRVGNDAHRSLPLAMMSLAWATAGIGLARAGGGRDVRHARPMNQRQRRNRARAYRSHNRAAQRGRRR